MPNGQIPSAPLFSIVRGQEPLVFFTGDVLSAHALEMGREYLAIDERVVHFGGKMNERKLGCVIFFTEHALPAKDPWAWRMADCNPVKPACKFTRLPDFNAVCVAHGVQFFISLHHAAGDPGATLPFSFGLRTIFYHRTEIFIHAHRKFFGTYHLMHALADPEFFGEQYKTFMR